MHFFRVCRLTDLHQGALSSGTTRQLPPNISRTTSSVCLDDAMSVILCLTCLRPYKIIQPKSSETVRSWPAYRILTRRHLQESRASSQEWRDLFQRCHHVQHGSLTALNHRLSQHGLMFKPGRIRRHSARTSRILPLLHVQALL